MVYAMLIVFLFFFYIHIIHCQTTTNFISNCAFLNNIYQSNIAVTNQFQAINSTSVKLTANYAFLSSPISLSTFQFGLIYPLSPPVNATPFPILLNCSAIIKSCELKTLQGNTFSSRDSEPIRVLLTSVNYTSTSIPFNQMSLYLTAGQYQLSNCSLDDGQSVTDPRTTFNIQIQYEKSIGTFCNPLNDACGSSSLTTCSSSSLTCACLPRSSPVSFFNSYYCADTLNASNCSIFPTRCVTWCNATTNSLCICPAYTLKIQRNNSYVCELPVNSNNCSINDSISRCSLGQGCVNGICIDNVLITTAVITTAQTNPFNDSTDQRLRIVLGVIAGLLGTSVLVLIGAFCWLRHRQKQRRLKTEKSLSPSQSSSTSSIYISPIQKPDDYQKPFTSNKIQGSPKRNFATTTNLSKIYRTDSFRQAVLSGRKQTIRTIEYVSTNLDSFIERRPQHDRIDTPIYSTLDFSGPNQTMINNQNFHRRNSDNNIYQVIIPTTVLSHDV